MWNPFRRRVVPAVLSAVTINIPYVGAATFVPDESETRAAWALYVELVTRVPVAPVDAEHGSMREVLESIYALFGETRRVLREAGPRTAGGSGSFAPLAIGVLNDGLRPFLTKWHSRLASHEDTRETTVTVMEHERTWPERTAWSEELDELANNLRQYADELLKLSGARRRPSDG